jgi:choline-sulfatase
LRFVFVGAAVLASTFPAWAADPTSLSGNAAHRPNVLMIVIDDLNDWVGFLGGNPQATTPNMDSLAAAGTAFANAHVQAPLCNPSRTSVLSGLRPSTSGIYGLRPGPRQSPALRDWVMLPQYFERQGYFTACYGKVYHDGAIPLADRPAEFDVFGPAPGMPMPREKFVSTPSKMRAVDWGVYPPNDQLSCDWITADHAITQLGSIPSNRPFFLAVGFRLPHLPIFATQAWFDRFPADKIVLPPVFDHDRDDTPRFSWYLHWDLPEPRLRWLEQHQQWVPLVRSYLAGTRFMDSQIGRVLAALKASGQGGNTIVVLWSDNGWHLGEKLITGKNSLWERSTHVPLIFAGPGVAPGGFCRSPAELLDIYPTLIDLCGLPGRGGLEGHSLLPQLRAADAPRHWPALTTSNGGNTAVRTARWRYIRYADGSEEFYDERTDPNEWTNLAGDPHYAAHKAAVAKWLPAHYAAPAPGSADRTLTWANGIATWEGKVIPPDAPIPGLDQD